MGTFRRRRGGRRLERERHKIGGRDHSDMIGCEPGSWAQSSLLIPESISERRSGTCCFRDAHRILLFVFLSLIGTIGEQREDAAQLPGVRG